MIDAKRLEALVVSLALTGSLQLYIPEPILQEYERVLYYRRLNFLSENIQAFLKKVHHASRMVVPKHTLHQAMHEADNPFLECAEAANADFLITGNTKHFPRKWKATKIVNAREFIPRCSRSVRRASRPRLAAWFTTKVEP
jgi:putative PIN family toxin of toxin-antitoxin system